MERNFMKLLKAQWEQGKFVCVGLDSEFGKIPKSAHRPGNECEVGIANTIVAFNHAIVEATKDLVCAYKPNIAFYEAHGEEGLSALHRTIVDIHLIAPDVPVILDAKRADIGNTNEGYAIAAFDFLQADAITVHPYLGKEALEPFLKRKNKGVIVLCQTSNPGASEFQGLWVPCDITTDDHMRLYQYVAQRVSVDWNMNGNCALVVGAPYPGELKEVRRTVGDMPILIPGVGFQQKGVPLEQQVGEVVSAGKNSRGEGMIINSSRGVIFASSGKDFADAAQRETLKLHNLINQFRFK